MPLIIHVVARTSYIQYGLISILQEEKEQHLPDPHDTLAQSVPSASIVAANSDVCSVIESQKNKMRGQYAKYTPDCNCDNIMGVASFSLALKLFLDHESFTTNQQNF